jgi:hypothetical protein
MEFKIVYGTCGHPLSPNPVKVPYWECPECGNGRVPKELSNCPVCNHEQTGGFFILKGCPICHKDKLTAPTGGFKM